MDLRELHVDELAKRAREGDSEAQFILGARYYGGDGTHQDLSVAAEWLKRASLQGHAQAQFTLGHMCSLGHGVPPDLSAALEWYSLAAQQGLPDAQNNLAGLYEQEGRYELAAEWYRAAADQGHAAARASLGFALSVGRGVPVDEAAAVECFRMASGQGFAPAQFNLGLAHARGRGTPANPVLAAHWIRAAANQGFGPAQMVMGDFCSRGFGVPADSEEAVQWFLRGAVEGLPAAQNALALRYADGDGVEPDQLRAFMWFSAAAGQGHPDAIRNRDRVSVDQGSHLATVISAAAAGEPAPQRELALRLHEGREIAQDDDAARYWLRRAAESGDAESQTAYALQLGPSDDAEVAVEKVRWLSLAADQGNPRAQFNLGLRQVLGDGAAMDGESGMANMIRASLAGFEPARGAIEQLQTTLGDRLPSVLEDVNWPSIILALGPHVEGHLDPLREARENDDGSEDPEWLRYDRESIDGLLRPSGDRSSPLMSSVFGQDVTVEGIHVGRAIVGGQTCVAVTISLHDIRLASGLPVFWRPPEKQLDAIAQLIGNVEGRMWVHWTYVSS